MGAYLRLRIRLRHAADDEERHAVERQMRRLVRTGIRRIVLERAAELGGDRAHPKREMWDRLARRFDSCEYVKPIRNGLTGTVIGFPFSCRVAGCPHCERERVDRLRERYLAPVRAARTPRVAYLTMPHRDPVTGQLLTGVGQLDASWKRLGDAWGRLWRSPLFRGADKHGRPRRCRPGRVGCLAALGELDMELRRWCRGRCQRDLDGGWHAPVARDRASVGVSHPACRPCLGHATATAAIIALEATVRRRDRQWHPHMNVLFEGDYIAQRDLCAAWARALGFTDPVVTYIRMADRPPAGHRGGRWTREKALFETVKYAIKPDDKLVDSSAPHWYVEWAEARDGRRMVRSYGAWFGLDADEDELVDEGDAGEATVTITDQDSGRRYTLPALDPLTDEPADWMTVPGDMLRHRFAQVLPPGAGRRRWLVTHNYARFGAEEGPP